MVKYDSVYRHSSSSRQNENVTGPERIEDEDIGHTGSINMMWLGLHGGGGGLSCTPSGFHTVSYIFEAYRGLS
jgi:hypothetical protein